jgi:uncharacterized protein
MAWYDYVLVVLSGAAAGFINMLAGNGSLLTLPVLIFIGLPPSVANATNRVGVTLQNIVGVAGFRSQGKMDGRGALLFAIPTTLGSILGAQIAVDIDEQVFKRVLAVVMIIMLVLMFVDSKRWLQGKGQAMAKGMTVGRFLLFFAIGVYGGFLQAGVGIFLLAALVLSAGYDVVRGNAVKVAIVLALTAAALFIFASHAKVDWPIGLLMGVGNMIGAWLGTRFAADKGAVWVQRFVIAVVLASVAQLLGVFEWLAAIV